jgi:hypothetical protein
MDMDGYATSKHGSPPNLPQYAYSKEAGAKSLCPTFNISLVMKSPVLPFSYDVTYNLPSMSLGYLVWVA